MTVEGMDLDATEGWFQTARNIRTGIDNELGRVAGLETSARNAAEASRRPSNSGTTQLNAVMATFVATETFAYDVYNTIAVTDFTEADAARLAELRQIPQHIHLLDGTYAELLILEMKLEDAKAGDRGIQPPRRHPDGFTGGDPNDPLGAMATAIQALHDTEDGELIWQDEFEFVAFTDPDTGEPTGSYMLVLPGVTDLSSAKDNLAEALGWSPDSYTSRDTFIAAKESHGSAEVDHNVYAQLIQDFIEEQIAADEIPLGANVAIVGHSFGADTALDLASSEYFNGELVNVTHVVAAAYHSEPQFPFVQDHTQVAVIQNIFDIPVLAESLLDTDNETLDGILAGEIVIENRDDFFEIVAPELPDILDQMGDDETLERLVVEANQWYINTGGGLYNAGADRVDGFVDGVEAGVDDLGTGVDWAAEAAADAGVGFLNGLVNVGNAGIPVIDPIQNIGPVEVPNLPDVSGTIGDLDRFEEVDLMGNTRTELDNITLVEFEGGWAGAGHEQSHYINYLEENGSGDFSDFFESMTEQGFVGSGTAVSVDVTVPDEIRNPADPVVPVVPEPILAIPVPAPVAIPESARTPIVVLEPTSPPVIAGPPAPGRTPVPILTPDGEG